MLRNIVFTVLCAFIMPPILMPVCISNDCGFVGGKYFSGIRAGTLDEIIINNLSVQLSETGEQADLVESALICPSNSTTEDQQEAGSTLKNTIYSQLDNAKRFDPLTASDEVYIRMDPETLHCYERDEQIILEAFATLSWHDRLICWNPADFDNVNNVSVKNGDLWMPKIVSYTKSIETFDLMYEVSECTVYSNGTVSCRYILYLTGMCKMHLRDWPLGGRADCWVSLEILNPTGRQKLRHRDDRPGYAWLDFAYVETPGQFKVVDMERETDGNGVTYRFLFVNTTEALAHALIIIAAVLSLVLVSSFGLPAGSTTRMSLLGCVCVSLLLSIEFLGDQLSSVTPDTPDIVRLHDGILIIAAIALLPATFLAPRLTTSKPYNWQLRLRSWLLSSSIGRFLLLIFRVPNPADKATTLGEDGQQNSSFQKEESETSNCGEDSTRTLLFTLFDRLSAAVCSVSLLGLWGDMFIITDDGVWPFTHIM